MKDPEYHTIDYGFYLQAIEDFRAAEGLLCVRNITGDWIWVGFEAERVVQKLEVIRAPSVIVLCCS